MPNPFLNKGKRSFTFVYAIEVDVVLHSFIASAKTMFSFFLRVKNMSSSINNDRGPIQLELENEDEGLSS